MGTPHYFIAIPLPKHLMDTLFNIQTKLKPNVTYKSWTEREDFHITLKFLGEVDDKRVEELNKHLTSLSSLSSFKTTVENISHFGNENCPRVLFAAVNRSPELESLKKKVEEITLKCRFENEKRDYNPHITLAKKWDGVRLKKDVQILVEKYNDIYGNLIVNEVVLYKIHPKNNPKYEAIYCYRLKE